MHVEFICGSIDGVYWTGAVLRIRIGWRCEDARVGLSESVDSPLLSVLTSRKVDVQLDCLRSRAWLGTERRVPPLSRESTHTVTVDAHFAPGPGLSVHHCGITTPSFSTSSCVDSSFPRLERHLRFGLLNGRETSPNRCQCRE